MNRAYQPGEWFMGTGDPNNPDLITQFEGICRGCGKKEYDPRVFMLVTSKHWRHSDIFMKNDPVMIRDDQRLGVWHPGCITEVNSEYRMRPLMHAVGSRRYETIIDVPFPINGPLSNSAMQWIQEQIHDAREKTCEYMEQRIKTELDIIIRQKRQHTRDLLANVDARIRTVLRNIILKGISGP